MNYVRLFFSVGILSSVIELAAMEKRVELLNFVSSPIHTSDSKNDFENDFRFNSRDEDCDDLFDHVRVSAKLDQPIIEGYAECMQRDFEEQLALRSKEMKLKKTGSKKNKQVISSSATAIISPTNIFLDVALR